ncbi:MAG: HlyD family efflux transporter periplasmic adaptor subunit [Planctomycetaceae bacterium]|nr:HlyD family efflux transporter periplasmic adaptor subunit [Planctomycetaceae bacterium]
MPLEHLEHRPLINEVERRRTMLCPVAYNESVMPALQLTRSSRWARKFANCLFVCLILAILLMLFAPWQQSIWGTGSIIAYAPDKRQQIIESPITGKIVRWGEGIAENMRVSEGELIAEIRDLDESYASRLEQQLDYSQLASQAAVQQLDANLKALEAIKTIVDSCQGQVRAYEAVKEETIASQNAYVKMAEDKVRAEMQQLSEYQAALPQLKAEFERMKLLEAERNISLQKFQEVERKYNESLAKVRKAEAYLDAARSELEGKKRERVAKIEKAQVDIEYANATLRKAISDVSKAESEIAKAQQELQKTEKDVLSMQVNVARQQNQLITAPFDGYVVRINPNLGTAVLKQGDPICTIVPDTADRIAQIWLSGNDAPLVEPGRHVRLQFEGWPALQFAGWPSVAVGTFGGEVISVDAVDDGKGKFRVLIRPAQDDHRWPEGRFLRQGVRANAWVLLDQVPLWYEVWRRLNAFPPVVNLDPEEEKPSKSKPPKLPKQ